ncbi:peptidylprolyl isomerase [Chachezhania sediminis]|uniref:peptidylprolyl isomerase n=1 Tax=Chachezhania sediminis TaxID=2599291 RepID=UPI00131CA023|nr:peptidylprolyl isomerase [Chachezhania sediminis]
MPSSTRFFLTVACVAGLSLPVAAQTVADAPDPDTVVARVNGQEITLGHMIVAQANLPQQYQQLPPDVLFSGILDQLIQQTALVQSEFASEPPIVGFAVDNERRALIASTAVEAIMAEAASEEDLRAAYDSQYGSGYGAEEFNASHILVETEEEAAAIREELENGADFATLAKEKSTGPSGPQGGELGWFSAGMMVAPFQEAVEGLESGQVSDPVQTQFGWHVIKLNDKRRNTAPPFEEVADQIANEMRQEAVTRELEKLVEAADVEKVELTDIPPETIRNIDLVRK